MFLFTKRIVLPFIGGVFALSVSQSQADIEQLKRDYVNQQFGMFIHFNMSAFTRQPFLTGDGELQVGRMPAFAELDTNKDNVITAQDNFEEFRVLKRMKLWHTPEKLARGLFDESGKLTKWFKVVAKEDDRLTEAEYEKVREDVDKFYPIELNVEQWAEAAQAAGMSYAILTTKHQGGFGLWDSKAKYHKDGNESEVVYDVGSTGWAKQREQDGKEVDIVKMFVEAFTGRGIKVGFYYSMQDRTHGRDGVLYGGNENDTFGIPTVDFGDDLLKYNLVKDQLKELLEYGTDEDPISIVWIDNWETRQDGFVEFSAVPFSEISPLVKGPHPESFPQRLLFANLHAWDPTIGQYDPKVIDGNEILADKTDIQGFETNIDGFPPRFNDRDAEVYNSIRANEDITIESSKFVEITANSNLEFKVQLTNSSVQRVSVEIEKFVGQEWMLAHTISFDPGSTTAPLVQVPIDNIQALRIRALAPIPIQVANTDGKIIDSGSSLWFYHPEGNARLKSLDEIVFRTRIPANNRKATYLLNVTPDDRGRIPSNQVELLRQIGKTAKANDLLAFKLTQAIGPDNWSDDTAKCPDNAKKLRLDFTARLTNLSHKQGDFAPRGKVLSHLHVKVNKLPDNVILPSENCRQDKNSDKCVLEGDTFPLPNEGGYRGGDLMPGESVDVPFTVCLANTEKFPLIVDVMGLKDYDVTAPALIQSNLGNNEQRFNFEMVVREGDQLRHWWRKNGDESNQWIKGQLFGRNVSSAPAFIQSNLPGGGRGNFEVVVREGDQLAHYFRGNNTDDGIAKGFLPGNDGVLFAEDVNSAPALIQSNLPERGRGNFEVVYRDSNNQLRHWFRRNDVTDFPWVEGNDGKPFGENVTSAPAMIQSDFGGNFEVVVQEGDRLRHYWRDNSDPAQFEWQKDEDLFTASNNVSSAPALIQSSFGDFEVIVREERIEDDKDGKRGDRLRRYWRDSGKEWHKENDSQMFISNVSSAPTLIESKLESDRNFEVVVREGDQLVHYFRENAVTGSLWETSGEIRE